MITTLLVVLAQVPPMLPPAAAPPLDLTRSSTLPVPFIGTPGVSSSGTEWVIAWKDQRPTAINGPATLFVTTFDGTNVSRPRGRPIGGPPATLQPEPLSVVSTASNTFIGHVIPSPDGGTALVVRMSGDGGVFGSWSTLFTSVGRSRFADMAVLGASASSLVAAWYSDESVFLERWPPAATAVDAGPTTLTIDAGPDIVSLSIGEVDGGFLVGWVNSQALPVVTLVGGLPLSVIRQQLVTGAIGATGVQILDSPVVHRFAVRSSSSWTSYSFLGNTPLRTQTPAPFTFAGIAATRTAQLATWEQQGDRLCDAALLTPAGTAGQAASLVTGHRTLTFTGSEQQGLVLSTSLDGGGVFAQQVNVSGASIPVVSPEPARELLQAPATQRFPAAVWSDADRAFVVAWDEAQPGGTFRLMTSLLDLDGGLTAPSPVANAQPLPVGSQPLLLRSPDGGALAVQRGSPGSRVVSALSRSGQGFTLGPVLAIQGAWSGAVLGDRVVLQWGRSTTGTQARANVETQPRFNVAGLMPSCAAQVGDWFWLPIATDGGLLYQQVHDGDAGTMAWLEPTDGLESNVCAAAGADGGLTLAFRSETGIDGRVIAGMTSQLLFSSRERAVEGPLVVHTRTGILFAWIDATRVVRGAFVAGASPSSFDLGAGDVANLSIAGSPVGVGVVLWDVFDPDDGARRVQLRLIDTALQPNPRLDGGIDASVINPEPLQDAGLPDAGPSFDGGLDAAVIIPEPLQDAGLPDAGPFDAGPSFDGAPTDPVVFVPVCGCGSVGLMPSLVLAALALVTRLRRRGREGRQALFP
ncbi:MAG: hypothetical protein JNJ54_20005 [Myxococcaceae bacterium]|nr:hypothetical protein [Myxococcaceae bacterium]